MSEAFEKWFKENGGRLPTWYSNPYDEKALELAYTAGVQAERERCAVKAWYTGMDLFTAEPNTKIDPRVVGSVIAAAIRMEAENERATLPNT